MSVLRARFQDFLRRWRWRRELGAWERNGRPEKPPEVYKQRLVRETAERLALRVLVETGTRFGDMIFATRDLFEEIYSIELDGVLYERARRRFRAQDHIHIVPGDSGAMLPFVLPRVAGRPTLFWLDAHMMEGGVRGELVTPITQELREILASDLEDAALLIDDARLFTGRSDYPTLGEVEELVARERPGWTVHCEHDVIRIHPDRGIRIGPDSEARAAAQP